jgi:hypothetical protein
MKRIRFIEDAFPVNDPEAYKAYPHFRHLFNKLFVMKSQNIRAGKMNEIPDKFPVFVKPIINLQGSNKDCYVVKSLAEYKKFMKRKELFWSEFLTGREKSTDLFLLQGKIMFKMTYVIKIADDDNFLEDYKRIYGNPYPISEKLIEWTKKYYKNHTGIVNIQYRGDTIFETSPRPDYGGTYIEMTGNQFLIDAVHNLYLKQIWLPKGELTVKKFYEFQVIGRSPFLTTLPNHLIDRILSKNCVTFKELYDDYGENKKIIYAFFSEDKKVGLKAKMLIERLMFNFNICLIVLFLSILIFIISSKIKYKYLVIVLIGFIAFRLLVLHRVKNLTKEYSKTLGFF